MNLVSLAILAFIVLKLAGIITCSWLWMLAPIWGYFLVVGFVMLISRIDDDFHG